MTPEEKIAALVEHIKKEFPKGCKGVNCDDCPLLHTNYKGLCVTMRELIP